jgi:hypothetical protein
MQIPNSKTKSPISPDFYLYTVLPLHNNEGDIRWYYFNGALIGTECGASPMELFPPLNATNCDLKKMSP